MLNRSPLFYLLLMLLSSTLVLAVGCPPTDDDDTGDDDDSGPSDDDDDDDDDDTVPSDDDDSAPLNLPTCEGPTVWFTEVEPNDGETDKDLNIIPGEDGDLVITGTASTCSNDGNTWTGDQDLFSVEYGCMGDATFTLEWTGTDNDMDYNVLAPDWSDEEYAAVGYEYSTDSPEQATSTGVGGPMFIQVMCWEGAVPQDWTFTIDWTSAPAGDDDDSAGDDDDSAGDDDDSAGDDDDSAAPPPDPTCADYCASRVTNCGDDMAVCTATCGLATGAGLLAGAWSDTGGNTLGCRIYHSGVAAGDNTSTHCGHSNLFGGTSADGFPCTNSLVEPYCGLMMANCTGANSQFADGAACWAAAGSVPDDSTTPWPTAGDSIQCRIYHAEVAASSGDPGTHCPHAGGAAPCQ